MSGQESWGSIVSLSAALQLRRTGSGVRTFLPLQEANKEEKLRVYTHTGNFYKKINAGMKVSGFSRK